MWCEIEHLGGSKPVKRIFARAKKPYTPDTVYASLILDQKDTSNDNQVGDKSLKADISAACGGLNSTLWTMWINQGKKVQKCIQDRLLWIW